MKYFHHFIIKFHLPIPLLPHQKLLINKMIGEKKISNISIHSNMLTGIINSSINNLEDHNSHIYEDMDYFTGQKKIPLEKFQERMQNSQMMYDWNEMINKFYPNISFSAWEWGYFE